MIDPSKRYTFFLSPFSLFLFLLLLEIRLKYGSAVDLNVVNKDGRCKKIVSRNCQCIKRRVAEKKISPSDQKHVKNTCVCTHTHTHAHTHIYIHLYQYLYVILTFFIFYFFYNQIFSYSTGIHQTYCVFLFLAFCPDFFYLFFTPTS